MPRDGAIICDLIRIGRGSVDDKVWLKTYYFVRRDMTKHQDLGTRGELLVVKCCACPRCKRKRTLRRLPPNFKCADVICDFCGYLAQVKAASVMNVDVVPPILLGAAWEPQKKRMDAGIYFPLFLVLVTPPRRSAIYYLSADVQGPKIFKPRQPLSAAARRAGWQGFLYDLASVRSAFIRLV
jgi:type II restriction enzyme